MNKISNEQEVLINIARKVLQPGGLELNKSDADIEYVKKFSDDLVISTELGRYIHSTIKKAEHIECLMNETQEVDISGMSIKTMDFHHTLLILFENAYSGVSRYTGIMRIKDYVDIFVFVKEYSKEINWVKLQSLANKYEMLHQVRDIINYLNLLYNDVIPKDVIELFSHKQATYKIERCETNYIFEWESSFFDRLFNNDLRKTEINRLLKKRCYSNDNTHYCNPIKLRGISELDVANLDKYYSFNDDKYKYSIMFFPSYKGNNLHFHIYLDSEVLGLLDKFFITISFLEKDTESSSVWRRFMIEHKNSKLVVCFNQKQIADGNIHRIHQGGIIEVKIPFSELSIDIAKAPIKLGFNLLLQEYIYEHEITHVIGAKHKICWQTSCWDCGILEIPDLL